MSIMNVKNILFAAFASAAMLFASCDEIGEGDRYIAVTPTTPVDTTGTDTGVVVKPITRTVLVEEFSGQLCVNCPAATESLEAMQEAIGGTERVTVVSIHAGQNMMLAIGEAQGQQMGVQGLATDFGEQLFSRYGLTSEPNAVIDRRGGVVSQPQWLTSILTSLTRETPVALSAQASYDESNNTISVNVSGRATQAFAGKIHVWLAEDSIVSMQRLPNGYDYNHVFNNIFRVSATPIDGDNVSVAKADVMNPVYSTSVAVKEAWRPENMKVIVFVDDASGVVQSTSAEVSVGK